MSYGDIDLRDYHRIVGHRCCHRAWRWVAIGLAVALLWSFMR